ncbi:MAG TPA: alpha-isopropylmalate synthase regulatory domain-containing protein [Polyangiales bacterium]
MFTREYVAQTAPIKVVGYRSEVRDGKQQHAISAEIEGVHHVLSHDAPGPIDAFVHTLSQRMGQRFEVESYTQHALDQGSKARAVAYVCLRTDGGERRFGVGVHESIVSASLAAVASAVNRLVASLERERAVG